MLKNSLQGNYGFKFFTMFAVKIKNKIQDNMKQTSFTAISILIALAAAFFSFFTVNAKTVKSNAPQVIMTGEIAKKVINEVPLFRGLFIYVSKYPEAEKEIRNQEGYTWSAYKAALDYMSKLKGGK